MINYESIISVFNEKGTLLKWLKKVEKALKESVLTNVEVLQGENNTFAFNFTFEDNTSITTEYVAINPQITASQLHELIGGSSTIVVDLNELQNKLIVKLDEEYKKTLATQSDVENLESELTNKQNEIVDSEEIVKHSDEENKLYLNNNVSNKINKALQIPADAPTATELVGVDTNKAQVNIGIGEGLSLENGTLKASGGSGGQKLYRHTIANSWDEIFTITLQLLVPSNVKFTANQIIDALRKYCFQAELSILNPDTSKETAKTISLSVSGGVVCVYAIVNTELSQYGTSISSFMGYDITSYIKNFGFYDVTEF